ncbi:hypothetical protein KBA63_00745 [Candidatus Woesebacteria bacterium]|nr:hypothetical protein [Candidatus Woesebacteria bacterium]
MDIYTKIGSTGIVIILFGVMLAMFTNHYSKLHKAGEKIALTGLVVLFISAICYIWSQ